MPGAPSSFLLHFFALKGSAGQSHQWLSEADEPAMLCRRQMKKSPSIQSESREAGFAEESQ